MLLLSKILTQMAFPLFQGLVLILLGLLFMALQRRRLSLVSLWLGAMVIWVFSTPAISNALRASLETRYPPVPIASLAPADAIVILGGAVAYPLAPRLEVELTDQSDRVLYAARLHRAGKAPLILASGGKLPWSRGGSEAEIIKALLMEWGVPEDAILTESSSRTTWENVIYTRKLLETHDLRRVLLVTSAMHMPRSVATFEAFGIDVVPATTDVTVVERGDGSLLDWLPSSGALEASSRAIKEYLGMWVYRLREWNSRQRR